MYAFCVEYLTFVLRYERSASSPLSPAKQSLQRLINHLLLLPTKVPWPCFHFLGSRPIMPIFISVFSFLDSGVCSHDLKFKITLNYLTFVLSVVYLDAAPQFIQLSETRCFSSLDFFWLSAPRITITSMYKILSKTSTWMLLAAGQCLQA